jgi:hypothetical protein
VTVVGTASMTGTDALNVEGSRAADDDDVDDAGE